MFIVELCLLVSYHKTYEYNKGGLHECYDYKTNRKTYRTNGKVG